MSGPSSQSMPNHFKSCKTASSDSFVDLSMSVSSTLNTNLPSKEFLANSQLNKAVLAPPTCKFPVGDGANLTRIYK